MCAQFDYDGRIHTFQVSIGPRPDGKIGPPPEVIVDAWRFRRQPCLRTC
jgi:hypothetical protein